MTARHFQIYDNRPRGTLQPGKGVTVELIDCPKCGQLHAEGECRAFLSIDDVDHKKATSK